MRNTFMNTLFERASKDPKIVFITGDLGYSVVERFADELPNQFLNVGIAEQSMVGIAAGLASEGFRCFVYSIANFPTMRCLEQIRNDVCYHNLPVTIVSVGAGVSYGSLGYTHHAVEDLAIMRPLPNIIVGSPADPMETIALTNFFVDRNGPGYLRLGKNGEPAIHNSTPELSIGKPIKVRPGDQGVIFATGNVLNIANEAASVASRNLGIEISVWSFPFIKPIAIDSLQEILTDAPFVLTVEEHVRSGGFGSAILEACSDNDIDVQIRSVFLNESPLTAVGSADYIRSQRGLSVDSIVSSIKRCL